MKTKWRRKWDDEFKGYVLEPYMPIPYWRGFCVLALVVGVAIVITHC